MTKYRQHPVSFLLEGDVRKTIHSISSFFYHVHTVTLINNMFENIVRIIVRESSAGQMRN